MTIDSSVFDKTFRDDDGDIVIAQKPNLPILIWLSATLLNFLPTGDILSHGLDALAFGTLFTWAWLELFQGVNYFRRSLGFAVLVGVLISKL